MRLAYFTNTYPRATDTFIRREVIGLRKRGFDVVTYSVRKAGGDHDVDEEVVREKNNTRYILPAKVFAVAKVVLATLLRKPGTLCKVAALAARTARPGLKGCFLQVGYFLEAIVLADFLKRDGVEHIHNHLGDNSGTVTLLAAKLAGVPYSITIHGPHIFFDGPSWALDKKTEHAKFISCIGHFCTSQMMLYAAREHWHKFEIVRCGVDTKQFQYRAPRTKAKKLVYVGRLSSEKGLPILFQSLALLKSHDLQLTILGDGAERKSLEKLTRDLNIEARVTFAGFVDQDTIRKVLNDSDVFVLPSFAEGIPVALMEAMAIGLPVIATYVGGVTELVVAGETGEVVAASDAQGLADAIARYADDLAFCQAISRKAREKVEREFAIDDQVDKLALLFARKEAANNPDHGKS
jgi:colanic acid/amylovoran biosynthesis glycosyltransferase